MHEIYNESFHILLLDRSPFLSRLPHHQSAVSVACLLPLPATFSTSLVHLPAHHKSQSFLPLPTSVVYRQSPPQFPPKIFCRVLWMRNLLSNAARLLIMSRLFLLNKLQLEMKFCWISKSCVKILRKSHVTRTLPFVSRNLNFLSGRYQRYVPRRLIWRTGNSDVRSTFRP